MSGVRTAIGRRAALALALTLMMPAAGRADDACSVPDEWLTPLYRFTHLARPPAKTHPLTVVVLGSGSSLGAGVSKPANAYPARLQVELPPLLGAPVTVVNKSVRGMTAAANLRRLNREILPLAPDLVVWEAGNTDAVENAELNEFGAALHQGIALLHEHRIDVILVASQYSPRTAALLDFNSYDDDLARSAEALDVPLFPRHRVMQLLTESGAFDPETTRKADQMRNADFVNACLARLLARMIALAATPGA